MALTSVAERSIFFRIYAGLLLVCLAVAFFTYLLVGAINQERLQSYREKISTGVFYLISQGVAHQRDEVHRQYWLSDASRLFGEAFSIIPMHLVDLRGQEIRRINEDKTVIRYDPVTKESTIYHRIPNENNLITVKISQVNEQQVRSLIVFLLDDLSYYPTIQAKEKRLEFLSQKFTYPIEIRSVASLNLDASQISRLRRDEPVILYKDGDGVQNSFITMVMSTEVEDDVIVVGPVDLFNWFPLNLIISMVLICILLVSLGVYGLIFPLERRLQLLQAGVNRVTQGDFNTKVQVVGHDDISRLSSTFNAMTQHIKRLIDAQRELTRAVSHELRTPVARIRFAVDMLADEDDYESRQFQKQYIDEDIEALNELIDEILTYAKLEEGAPKMDWEMVNLQELLVQIERETNALGKDIKVQVQVSPMKAQAMADRRYLHRVVQNLAGNAMRYAESTIIIRAGVIKGRAFVSVEDDGHGIKEEDRDKVFVPFARLDDSRTRASGGYGLGLSIVSRIAFWFNANLKVDESPDLQGARFIMDWPAKQAGVTIAADKLTQAKADQVVIGDSK
ncbi:ATP-binding protein [Moraxella sp. Tifton1]|uniref:ATP-binding protein n=1 Tax=Moraxella oculi TaxID=2940516 RepID=UPI0020131452|nr:ATP-binding protein [Moraxella sp. Tifton1]MCL1623297.1 ATP-binding protein [Moraxella sp. Tifton1]